MEISQKDKVLTTICCEGDCNNRMAVSDNFSGFINAQINTWVSSR